MKIQYASDLHLEFSENTNFLKEHPLNVTGDILLLAGDICYLGSKPSMQHPFWDWAADHYEQTYIVPGNHEYYGGFDLQDSLHDFSLPIRSNVCYKNNTVVNLMETELIFTTLWTCIPPQYLYSINQKIADCYWIVYRGDPFRAGHYQEVHTISLNFLEKTLQEKTNRKKIIISHHAPTHLCDKPDFQNSPLNSAFVVELKDKIALWNIDYWIYGHTHRNMPVQKIKHTQLICNQMGYVGYGEHLNFNNKCILLK